MPRAKPSPMQRLLWLPMILLAGCAVNPVTGKNELMLLDEPVAGMSDAETEQTAILLEEISKDRSLVVVEHDMEFVRNLDCVVSVLHEGSVIAEGAMDSIQSDPRVIEVYLGR